MKILIIGSEGFIGSHFVNFFLNKEYTLTGLDLFEQPSREYRYIKVSRLSPEFDEIFQQHSFDAVINAAGSGNVPYSMSHPLSDFEANCLDTIRVLDVIRKHQPECKYIHLSSAAVYGNPKQLPIREEDPTLPMSPYGWHKLISERLCQEYTSVYNLRTAVIRPFSVYGMGLKKQLFWDLHQKSRGNKNKIELFGTGKESRDFIHVEDMVSAVDLIIRNGKLQGECYNIASGNECTIEAAVSVFFQATGRDTGFYFNGKVREGDPLNWRADISKLTELGFKPATDLATGLQGVVKWMKSL
jgi:dTDP-glucose 4,6-dehydratase/UDP-glucose 4-epimerase